MICEWGDDEHHSCVIDDSEIQDQDTNYVMQTEVVGITIRGYDKTYAKKAIDFINGLVGRMYYCPPGSPSFAPIEKVTFVQFCEPPLKCFEEIEKKNKFTKKIKGQPSIRICLDDFSA